jgi:hypothetical protein
MNEDSKMSFTRAFADAYSGGRPSPIRALATAVGVGGAVTAAVYRLLRR